MKENTRLLNLSLVKRVGNNLRMLLHSEIMNEYIHVLNRSRVMSVENHLHGPVHSESMNECIQVRSRVIYVGNNSVGQVDSKRDGRTHTDVKIFTCDFCGMSSSQCTNLIVHVRRRPFSCDSCGKSFADSSRPYTESA